MWAFCSFWCSLLQKRMGWLVQSLLPWGKQKGAVFLCKDINNFMISSQTSRRAICWQKSTREALIRPSSTWAAVLVAKPSQTPRPGSSFVFTSQLWNGHEMRHWGWFPHYPLAFWFFKRDQNPIFPEERERRFTDFITNLKQIEQKIRGNVFFLRSEASFSNQRTSGPLSTFC